MTKKIDDKTTPIQKLKFLLNPGQRRQVFFLSILLIIGMLLEMASLGVLIPALGFMLDGDKLTNSSELQPLLNFLGNPSPKKLIILGMSCLVFVYLAKALFLIFLTWRQSKFSAEFPAELSSRLFKGYLHQPYTFHLQYNSAELLRNLRGEIGEFTEITKSIIVLTTELTVVVGIGFVLILQDPLGTLIITF